MIAKDLKADLEFIVEHADPQGMDCWVEVEQREYP